jgi:cytochrome c oxidase assembly protein subunit 11
MANDPLKGRKAATAGAALAVIAVMLGFVAVSPRLYRLVCKAIGADGTTQTAAAAPAKPSSVPVTVRFDANVDKDLPWEFKPNQKSVTIKMGESATISYHARNLSNQTITGTATFNVTPEKIGPYFDKIQCFCFSQQTLAPGEEKDLPVTFFVDPALLADSTTEEVRTVTLSYTFFRSLNPPAENTKVESAPAPALVPTAAAATVPPT